jgi:hypothetical protein
MKDASIARAKGNLEAWKQILRRRSDLATSNHAHPNISQIKKTDSTKSDQLRTLP